MRRLVGLFLVISGAYLLVAHVPAMAASDQVRLANQVSTTPESAERNAILASSVQIAMVGTEHITTIDGHTRCTQHVIKVAHGIATLVAVNESNLLVSHDHWELLDSGVLVRVDLRTANGDLLVSMDGERFMQLIRYRDGATLVLMAPEPLGVPGLAFAAPGAYHVESGTVVNIVHQDGRSPNVLAVSPAVVDRNAFKQGKQVMTLHTTDGQPIVPGDSGGGVWVADRLVGNVWSAVAETEEKHMLFMGVSWTSTSISSQHVVVAELPPLAYVAGAAGGVSDATVVDGIIIH